MSNNSCYILHRGAVYQLIGDESISKVVDRGVFNTNLPETARDNLADISNKKRMAGPRDKEMVVLGRVSSEF